MKGILYQCLSCKNVWIEYPNTRVTGICLDCKSDDVRKVATFV